MRAPVGNTGALQNDGKSKKQASFPTEHPQQTTHQPDALAQPVVVAQFFRNRRHEVIRVTLSRYQGRAIADCRIFFPTNDGRLQASKKGVAVNIIRLRDLAAAINRALKKAIDLGLIDSEAGK